MNRTLFINPTDWAVAQQPMPFQSICGDLALALPHETGVLFALIDGVGHGAEALHVAEIAADELRRSAGESLHTHLKRCHVSLKESRGVVLTLVDFDPADETITWCGVGNVEAYLFRETSTDNLVEQALIRSGTVGVSLPSLYAAIIPGNPGDCLVMVTDGIQLDFDLCLPIALDPKQIAAHILENHSKHTDDASVLVARLRGIHP